MNAFLELRAVRFAFSFCLLVHIVLVASSARLQSPTWDEIGHVAAGLSHWQLGRFNLYCVNPPLVRMIGALPFGVAGCSADWTAYRATSTARPEFQIGARIIESRPNDIMTLYARGRWACIPFSVLGAIVSCTWATELYGRRSGLLAGFLWLADPNIIAHAQLITPDVGAAACGVTACWGVWKWGRTGKWSLVMFCGLVVGMAELTKFTLVVLVASIPTAWVMWRVLDVRRRPYSTCLQPVVLVVVALWIVNAGYFFEGTFTRLRDFDFVSRLLAGRVVDEFKVGNRFRGTAIGDLPVPLPRDYLQGIDVQKREFERKRWSYLLGEWKYGGWWYYYVIAFAVKTPLGTIALALMAISFRLVRLVKNPCRDEIMLLLPAGLLFLLVSSQTGFSQHLRYMIPVAPFSFVWISGVVRDVDALKCSSKLRRFWNLTLVGLATWVAASMLSVFPHTLSFFNEAVGGPRCGHYYLLGSNIDWGQDLLFLERWHDLRKRSVRNLSVAYSIPFINPVDYGFHGGECAGSTSAFQRHGVKNGWVAISVNRLLEPKSEYLWLLQVKPCELVGYSFYIYHLEPD